MTRTILALGTALILTACGDGLPKYYEVAEGPYPPEVHANLPADIPFSDLLARVQPGELGPCYFYRRGRDILPLTLAENQGTEFADQPYCIQ